MRHRWCLAALGAALAGCAGTVPTVQMHAPPASYLLGIDQLVSPDFVTDLAPHPVSAAGIAASGGTPTAALGAAGFTAAAAEDFVRAVPSLTTSNGPVQVADTVEEFASSAGSAAVYGSDVLRLDARPGSTAVSTGSLGDAAHATMRTARTAGGIQVEEITVEWRVGNLLDLLVVRGRYGAIRPDDALLLAHRDTVTELGLALPRSPGPATPSPG